MADWTPTGDGAALRTSRDPEAARGVPQGHARALGPRAQERQRARRRPRRSCARGGVLPDRRASAQDRRRRHPERHLGRPDRGAAPRRPRRASPRSSSAATTRARSATATPATAARTPTASPGAGRRRRCRPRPIRAWCSSGCSATSTPSLPPEVRARRLLYRRSILDLVERADRAAGGRSRPVRPPQARRVPRRRSARSSGASRRPSRT